jgi:hypothetical protein
MYLIRNASGQKHYPAGSNRKGVLEQTRLLF